MIDASIIEEYCCSLNEFCSSEKTLSAAAEDGWNSSDSLQALDQFGNSLSSNLSWSVVLIIINFGKNCAY